VVHHPRDAIPLQGNWYGSASDHLAMKVAVKVKAASDSGAEDRKKEQDYEGTRTTPPA
jgi:hypothetical protein